MPCFATVTRTSGCLSLHLSVHFVDLLIHQPTRPFTHPSTDSSIRPHIYQTHPSMPSIDSSIRVFPPLSIGSSRAGGRANDQSAHRSCHGQKGGFPKIKISTLKRRLLVEGEKRREWGGGDVYLKRVEFVNF